MSEMEILERLRLLPREKQAEVFDFLDYLVGRFGQAPWTERGFAGVAFGQALRGMKDDPVTYGADDIRSPWR